MASRPYVENVTITPQVAQMMLEHNTHNRNLTESRAQAYARDMASGNWRYTGEGIKFGPDGTLLDGQTRLRAIVLSGVTITMPVWRGIDPDAQLVMDSGRPRSNSDALSLRGETVLENGMVFSNEPGVYFNGKFGIRIEDSCYLSGGVYHSFMKDDKSLVVIKENGEIERKKLRLK